LCLGRRLYGLEAGKEYTVASFREDYSKGTDIYLADMRPSWLSNRFRRVKPKAMSGSKETFYVVGDVKINDAEEALKYVLAYARKGEVPKVTKTTTMTTTEEL
jgi:hypothetical protein